MKIIHQNGYTPDELAVFRLVVYKNLVDSAKDVILAMKKVGVDCVEGINRVRLALIFYCFPPKGRPLSCSAGVVDILLW